MAPSIRARPAYLQARNPRLSLFSSSLVVVVVVVMVCASLKFPRVRMGKVGVCTYIHGGAGHAWGVGVPYMIDYNMMVCVCARYQSG